MPCFEIVRVVDDLTLVNAESRRCRYESTRADDMSAGYYIVLWPRTIVRPQYDRDAKFFGPFASRLDATDAIKDAIVSYSLYETE